METGVLNNMYCCYGKKKTKVHYCFDSKFRRGERWKERSRDKEKKKKKTSEMWMWKVERRKRVQRIYSCGRVKGDSGTNTEDTLHM
jgi:hypothetical protein